MVKRLFSGGFVIWLTPAAGVRGRESRQNLGINCHTCGWDSKMRVIAVVAALLLLLAGLPPGTAAAGDKTTVTVKTDPATAGTKVEILDPQGNRLAGGTTDANGEV